MYWIILMPYIINLFSLGITESLRSVDTSSWSGLERIFEDNTAHPHYYTFDEYFGWFVKYLWNQILAGQMVDSHQFMRVFTSSPPKLPNHIWSGDWCVAQRRSWRQILRWIWLGLRILLNSTVNSGINGMLWIKLAKIIQISSMEIQ